MPSEVSDHALVTVTVQVALWPAAAAVITLVPVVTPVTVPSAATVALAVVPLVQVMSPFTPKGRRVAGSLMEEPAATEAVAGRMMPATVLAVSAANCMEVAGVLPTMVYPDPEQLKVLEDLRFRLARAQIRTFRRIRRSPKVDQSTFSQEALIYSSPKGKITHDYKFFVHELVGDEEGGEI